MKLSHMPRCFSASAAMLAFASLASAQGVLQQTFGKLASDNYGWSANSAGDVDNDGYDDVIAGTFFGTNGMLPGSARVTSGRTGLVLHELVGTVPAQGFGYDVAGVGDLNADGHDDFVVGIRPVDYDAGGPGSAKVYSGKTGAVMFTFTGAGTNNSFGGAVNGAGDVNKDGVPDIVIGSPTEQAGGVDAGGVWVFSGANGALLWHFLGSVNDQLGIGVSGAGDVNGDGHADIIAGANIDDAGGHNAGSVHVWSGKTGAKLWSKLGSANAQMGVAVDSVGDVNGDGLSDIIVGAMSDTTGGTFAGKVLICVGSTGAVIHTLLGTSGSGFGVSVAGLDDVDGDGRGDFFVGAYGMSNGGASSGGLKAYSGKTASLMFTLYGDADDDWYGYTAASGDVNGDGFKDLIVGAPNNDLAGSEKGTVFVYSAKCGPIASYGTGCAGAGGFTPILAIGGCACPGGAMSLSVTKGLGGSTALLFIGATQSTLPIQGGCTLLTFPIVATIVVPLGGAGAGAGSTGAVGSVPMGTPLVSFAMQALVIDPIVPRGYSASNGVWTMIQ